MNITLSPETQRLLEEQMRKGRFSTPDDAVRTALRTLDEVRGADYETLDEETRLLYLEIGGWNGAFRLEAKQIGSFSRSAA